MRRLAVVSLLVLGLAGALASQALAGTYTAIGRIVDANGNPRAGWVVKVSHKYHPLYAWTVTTTTDASGNFAVSRDYATCEYIIVSPKMGNSKTLMTPSPGTYDFGTLIGGNCKNCPLPEDGSGP